MAVMNREFDVVVIGGGVVGCAIARELSRYRLRVAVLEKECDIGTQTSARNTGMLHAGFLYQTGSLKAQCAVEGNREFDRVAEELDVPFRRTGKLVVGFTEAHRAQLEQFMKRGESNGVPGLRLIDRAEMDRLDPTAGGNFAMYVPTSGVLNPFLYTIALAENAVHNGAELFRSCAFTGEIRLADGRHCLHTTRGDFVTRWVVNSAGLQSAMVSAWLGKPGYTIAPVKGEYFVLDKRAGAHASIPVYPAPNPDNTFDTHATVTVEGNVLVGPDSQWVEELEDYATSPAGLDGLAEDGARMFAHMKREYYIRSFAGVRPKLIDPKTKKVQDFKLEAPEDIPGFINLVGIESPGLTSALPLARRVAEKIRGREELSLNETFTPYRSGPPRFSELTPERQAELIAENADYGEIICRCEQVTKAEILQAIHSPVGAATVNGVKNRTRASMGRCQGGYCQMRITQMLRQELGQSITEVSLSSRGSYLFTGAVRGGGEE